jgi:hypothetical protein
MQKRYQTQHIIVIVKLVLKIKKNRLLSIWRPSRKMEKKLLRSF